MVADDLDLVVFLGDYIYESNGRANQVRKHTGGVPFTLSPLDEANPTSPCR